MSDGRNETMEKVSVIIPFYNGNKHLGKLKQTLERNCPNLRDLVELEVVIVNDSPWIEVEREAIYSDDYDMRIVVREQNGGIHRARVCGLAHASGDYVLFLDQDDVISADCIAALYQTMRDRHVDCVIGNGIFETNEGRKLILDSYGKVHYAKRRYAYFIAGNFLCSPGQCLLRKEAIPDFWRTHFVDSNCSDDLFLWCLMLKKKNVAYCNKLVYLHVNTGVNLSLDKANGYRSDLEVLKLLRESGDVPKLLLKIFEMRCAYNTQKLEQNVKKPISYAAYFILLNLFKACIRLVALAYMLTGRHTPLIGDFTEEK